jgi:hypothetical protein
MGAHRGSERMVMNFYMPGLPYTFGCKRRHLPAYRETWSAYLLSFLFVDVVDCLHNTLSRHPRRPRERAFICGNLVPTRAAPPAYVYAPAAWPSSMVVVFDNLSRWSAPSLFATGTDNGSSSKAVSLLRTKLFPTSMPALSRRMR